LAFFKILEGGGMGTQEYQVELIKTQEKLSVMREEIFSFTSVSRGCTTFRQDPAWMNWECAEGTTSPMSVVVKRGGEIVCLALGRLQESMFSIQFSVFKLPFKRARTLKVIGDEFLFAENADEARCVSLVLDAWNGLAKEVDLIYFEMLEIGGLAGRYLSGEGAQLSGKLQLFSTSPKKEFVWRHFLKESYDNWLSGLGGSTRRLVKRRVNKLEKEYPSEVELRGCSCESDIQKYLDHLDELYPKTWQAKTFGGRKRNTERDLKKFHVYAEMGALRSYMLFLQGRPVAFFTGLQYRDIFEAIEIGYDSEFSSLGVGSALNYMVIKELYSQRQPKLLSFGFGENVYKEMICTDSSEAYEAYITQGKLWAVVLRTQIALGKLEKVSRDVIIRLGIAGLIRRVLKNKG